MMGFSDRRAMMPSLDDLPLNAPDGGASPPGDKRPSRSSLVGLVALLVVAAGAAAFWMLRGRLVPAPAPAAASPTSPLAPADTHQPLGPAVAAVDLPPLDLTDPIVRELLGRLSSAPAVASWLATDGLIRNFVVSVENVAEGRSPARQLRRLAPTGEFQVARRGETVVVDPRSYDRYNALADAVASCDAAGLARLYSTLKPRLTEAYTELGHPDGDIDAAMERAIRQLLETPAVPAGAALVAPGVNYRYADPAVEALPSAQKQVLRLGPRNRQIILDKLREVAAELGMRDVR
jgi:hypothetical protein